MLCTTGESDIEEDYEEPDVFTPLIKRQKSSYDDDDFDMESQLAYEAWPASQKHL